MPESLKTFRAIAAEVTRRSGVEVSFGVVYRLAGDEEPVNNSLRKALNLPLYRKVKVNPPARLSDLSVSELRRRMNDREEYKP